MGLGSVYIGKGDCDFCHDQLKKFTNYYVRIVTRRKRNGVFCTVPVPDGYYNAGFMMVFIR